MNRGAHFTQILTLRVAVGLLGERANLGWWPTSFFEPSSLNFLDPALPRTARLAQYHGVVEAARRTHDEKLNVGSFHLFRLPEEREKDLHALMLECGQQDLERLPCTNEEATRFLDEHKSKTSDLSVGPTLIGPIGIIEEPASVSRIIDVYSSAIRRGVWAFPYFVSA
jgi:hypothetical protein